MLLKQPGRPQHVPTDRDRKQVEVMSGMGITHEDIARVIGISSPTLRRHYATELRTGATRANVEVAASLYRQATDKAKPNVIAGIFWLKARAGWRDRDGEIGKKEEAARKAGEASLGKYKPSAPPLKRVV